MKEENEVSYVCEFCGMRFKRQSEAKMHEDAHKIMRRFREEHPAAVETGDIVEFGGRLYTVTSVDLDSNGASGRWIYSMGLAYDLDEECGEITHYAYDYADDRSGVRLILRKEQAMKMKKEMEALCKINTDHGLEDVMRALLKIN